MRNKKLTNDEYLLAKDETINNLSADAVCPITFIGNINDGNNKFINDKNVNGLFTLGYELKKISDDCSRKTIDYVKNNIAESHSSLYSSFMYTEQNRNLNAIEATVNAYMINNIVDMTIKTLYDMAKDCFILPDGSSASFIGVSIDDIVNCIKSNISDTHFHFGGNDFSDPNLLNNITFIYYDQLMNKIIVSIISDVFERSILNTINTIFSNGLSEAFYKACYSECYGVAESDIADIPDDGYRYSFVTSIIREKATPYIVNLRTGLLFISNVAANMYCDLVKNSKYINDNYLESLKIDDEDEY